MKYCLKYTNTSTKLNHADEISIKYLEDKGLVDFMEKFSSQRIILRIDTSNFPESEVRKLIAIKTMHPEYNFAVAMNVFSAMLGVTLNIAGIPYFEAAPCPDWEWFDYLVRHGVSDINISGPLAFECGEVHRALAANPDITIRATPNKCLCTCAHTDSLIGFFIRPEDVGAYEDIIDVLEFEGVEHQDTFYSIYAEQKSFIGNLNQCIYDFHGSVDNKGLISLFGERRKHCGRKCLKGGRCQRCYDLADLSKPMGERAREKIMETIKKEQEELK